MNPTPKQPSPHDAKPYPKIYESEPGCTVQRIYIQYKHPTISKRSKKRVFF